MGPRREGLTVEGLEVHRAADRHRRGYQRGGRRLCGDRGCRHPADSWDFSIHVLVRSCCVGSLKSDGWHVPGQPTNRRNNHEIHPIWNSKTCAFGLCKVRRHPTAPNQKIRKGSGGGGELSQRRNVSRGLKRSQREDQQAPLPRVPMHSFHRTGVTFQRWARGGKAVAVRGMVTCQKSGT